MSTHHHFLDFERIWALWLCSGVIVIAVTSRIRFRIRRGLFQDLVQDETGAGYTIAYMMTIPLYILMVLMFFETSFMLIAKVGTVNAAFGAARSAIVWQSIDESEAQAKAEQAAIQGMAPYASGLTGLRLDLRSQGSGEDDFMAYYQANKIQGKKSNARDKYVAAKYRYAARAVRVELQVEPRSGGKEWDEDVVANVTYEYPYLFPILGRILGLKKSGGLFVEEISTKIPLQNETPRNEQKRLGISYASP